MPDTESGNCFEREAGVVDSRSGSTELHVTPAGTPVVLERCEGDDIAFKGR